MKDLLTVLIDAGADVNAECSRADGSKVCERSSLFFSLSQKTSPNHVYDWTLTYPTYV
jgi:hypothetical protein